MNKFQEQLTASNSELEGKRAELAATQALSGHKKVVSETDDEVTRLEIAILDHTDLGKVNTTDLQGRSIPQNWAQVLQDLNVKLLDAQVRQKIAAQTTKEWFTETPKADTND